MAIYQIGRGRRLCLDLLLAPLRPEPFFSIMAFSLGQCLLVLVLAFLLFGNAASLKRRVNLFFVAHQKRKNPISTGGLRKKKVPALGGSLSLRQVVPGRGSSGRPGRPRNRV
jgi:hypothetical protein